MARNIPRQNNEKREKSPVSRQLNFSWSGLKASEQMKLAFGVFFMLFAIFMFFAFASHLFTGNADQSEVEAALKVPLEESGKKTVNFFGIFGAMLADLMMLRLFGWASFLLIPIIFLGGFKITFHRELLPLERITWQALFYMFWLSTFFGFFVFMTDTSSSLSSFCGGIGYHINELLYNAIGWASILVILFVLFLFVVFYYKVNSLDAMVEMFDRNINGSEDSADETIEEDLENTPNMKRAREDLEQAKQNLDSEFEDDLTIEREDNDDLANIRPLIPPVVQHEPETEEKHKADSVPDKGPIALTIEPVISDDTVADGKDNEIFGEDDQENLNDEVLRKFGAYDPNMDLPHYKFPTLDLLKNYDANKAQVSEDELKANSDKIVETLRNYSIGIASIKATIGPTVTLYEIIPEAGVRISKIKNLEDDIALSLAALGIRIIAPIPGKGTIGIEVPNKNREMVPVKMVIGSEKFQKSNYDLPIVLGKTISNDIFMTDLAKMPHLLMAGATGQGKSVGLNMILTSLIYKKHPATLKFVLVDPKKVELTLFNKLERHFLAMLPDSAEAIITDTKKVVHTLNSLCIEMDNRYNLLKDAGCRNLKEYNVKFVNRRLNPEKGHAFMPYIVLVIDELADLMMTAGKEVEQPIARLAQLARAIGIHLVVATQRPSVNVITGTIKANFPARLSFKVTSKIDSRTILDTGGAEQLVGLGDMLLSNGSDIIRLQCAFVDTPEVEDVCEFIGNQQGYDSAYLLPEFEGDSEGGNEKSDFDPSSRDAFFDEAARLIVTHQQGSTSLIQRRLKLGYNRAGRLIDQLEAAGIVGPFEGSKAREVLVKDMESLEMKLRNL